MATITLASDKKLQLNSSNKEVSWGKALSELPAVIDNLVSEDKHIKSITLKFSGKIYNNNILPCDDEYVICGLTNNDSDAATNTSGGTGGTNLFKLGPLDVGGRKTVNYSEQSIDITKYFKATSPHSVQNTSYSRLSVAFTSQNIYTKDITFSLSLDIATEAHSYTSNDSPAATCTSSGTRTHTCSCGHSYTETISALGHSFGTTTAAKAATCTAAGNSAYKKCSRCNLYFAGSAATNATGGKSDTSSFTIAKKSHSYTGAIKSDGNGKDATHSFKCVNGCNQYGGAVKHTWNSGSVTKQPTCTESGVRTYTCTASGCGATYTETIPAKGHTEVTIPAVEPTCTATGLTAGKKCSVCGAIITAQQTVPAKGHSYTDVVTQPTETSNGYTTHTCKNDSSHSYVDTYTCLATFKNYDGSVLKTEKVNQGGTPTAPTNPTRTGYKFIGWSPAVGAINNSTVFTAVYEKLPPQITTVTITRSSDLANVSISAPVDAGAKFIISVEVT